MINKKRQKSMILKKNLEIKPTYEDESKEGIFTGIPTNSNNVQIFKGILSKSQISSR